MDTITQPEPDRAASVSPSLAQTFIQSIRAISAERAAEVEALVAERDSYRELALAAMAELGEMATRLDRERTSRLWLLSQYRALQAGHTAGDARLATSDDAILPEAEAA